ncbi:metallophosphoesterase family protein [Mesorhizobium sp. L-8-3]|uniref:metallophosphoesterase family protein n=1 Tax=Mesorhizobium sp. L-8-3 TaxID=2744522 RepID=UPI001925EA58|nr:metallophosphoesterase [Mesorhizobium sp. L-8-3]BCH27628.1 hypothetical protein MesoLjLb_74130 [Mesorhizobium sp. L-8-3]
MGPIIDPRRGDVEDDASSTRQRSMLSLAGSMLVEISLLKLALAWLVLLVVPGLLLGFAPIAATAWFRALTDRVFSPTIGFWSVLILAAIVAIGWYGGRQLIRLAESSFWSLTSIVVEPGYGACREGLRHVAERFLPATATAGQRSALRSAAAAVAGLVICTIAILVAIAAWPGTRLYSDLGEIRSLDRLAVATLANSITLVAAYLAAGALVWAATDTTMDQPRDLDAFDEPRDGDRRWRIAHLSDIHVVGERFGFRIESGRSGPRGNDRLKQAFARLQSIDEDLRLDAILISGDITDAGRSAEWAEFFEVLAAHPSLADRVLIIPGNHDLNIVDRANPARMDLPMSPNIKLRQLRALSAMAALQGDRVRVVDRPASSLGPTLAEAVEPHAAALRRFADVAKPRLFRRFDELWASVFPMVLPPREEDGLGIILLNSNTDTHFSFTNALGVISAEEVKGIDTMSRRYPEACWLIALHHHVVEYPRPVKAFSERIGTALINGNWFIRRLKPLAGRAVLMHGHRHVDWIGRCEGLLIVSAPSPVMEATDDQPTCFHVHTLAIGADRRLRLLAPERIVLGGSPSDGRKDG